MAQYGKYREDGAILLVEVLSDVTNEGGRTVTLRCLQVARGHGPHVPPSVPDPEVGQEWSSWAAEGADAYAGWSLELLGPNSPEARELAQGVQLNLL